MSTKQTRVGAVKQSWKDLAMKMGWSSADIEKQDQEDLQDLRELADLALAGDDEDNCWEDGKEPMPIPVAVAATVTIMESEARNFQDAKFLMTTVHHLSEADWQLKVKEAELAIKHGVVPDDMGAAAMFSGASMASMVSLDTSSSSGPPVGSGSMSSPSSASSVMSAMSS